MLTGILILACWVFLGVYWNISARSIKPTAEGQDWSGRLARMPIWLGYILLLVIWAYPFGMVAIRRTAVSGWLAVAICALGLLVSIWSRRALGYEWSRDVELKQGTSWWNGDRMLLCGIPSTPGNQSAGANGRPQPHQQMPRSRGWGCSSWASGLS